jgi:hypothetical protein
VILLNCDSEGVPNLVQRVDYRPSSMMYVFHLFNGIRRTIWEEEVPVQGIGLMTVFITPEMTQDAMDWFTREFDASAEFRERMEIAA